MIYATILILILFWAIGLVTSYTIASFINLMVLLAAILIFSTVMLDTKGTSGSAH